MSATALLSLAAYMESSYEPDCDYVDGILEERNVGKNRHSRTQTRLTIWLGSREAQHGCMTLTEQRVQVAPTRIRIPDICLVPQNDRDEVTQQPPALWIEVLSPEDRWNRVMARVKDCQNFGVPTIWIVDPYSNRAWSATPTSDAALAEDGKLFCPALNLELALEEILPEP